MKDAALMLLGGSAIWLVGRDDPRVRRWGWLAGIASQPFWALVAWNARDLGAGALVVWYTYAWAAGAWKAWRGKP
jgi:hypothetical protein